MSNSQDKGTVEAGEILALSMYTDGEVQAAVQEVFTNEDMVKGMRRFLPEKLCDLLLELKDDVHSSYDFQSKLMVPFLDFVRTTSMRGFGSRGLEGLDNKTKYLFISNHRDIGLDSAFLNQILFDNGFSTTQIAIGDNLMKHRLAALIFRINKSFAVLRSGSRRELYQRSIEMSEYMYSLVDNNESSIWLAQREGRAKDGNDRTQVGLLKMLSLSCKGDLVEHLKQLKIVPVGITYELDPTDLVKTVAFLKKKYDPSYEKTFEEDMQHILMGIRGDKGHVTVNFSAALDAELDELIDAPSDKQRLERLVKILDKHIHQNYQLRAVNYVAADLLKSTSEYEACYSAEEKDQYQLYFDEKLAQIPAEWREEGRVYLMGIYANPVFNMQVEAEKM